MADTNNYPNYIGVETTQLQSLKIKIKYTGGTEKEAVISEGSLVSVAHVTNINGVLTQELSLGIVKTIGSEPVAKTFNPTPLVSNPNYIVIDKSTTYKSDLVTIYVRDMRDIIVGPMADGDFAKGQMSGDTLPDVSDSNIMYLGRFFKLNSTDLLSGIYYCGETGWIRITSSDIIESSPLITSFQFNNGEKTNVLKNDIIVGGKNISNSSIDIPNFLLSTTQPPSIKISTVGSEVKYQVNAALSSYLPTNLSGEDYVTIVIMTLGETERPVMDSPINVSRVKIENVWHDIYHNITKEGNLTICYPNIAGIYNLNIFGSYLL